MTPLKEGARIPVPGMPGVQGIVIGVEASVPGFPVYRVHYMDNEGAMVAVQCGHTDIMQAGASPVPPKSAKPKRKR